MNSQPANRPGVATGLVLFTAVLLGVSLVNTPFPWIQSLQHAPTVIALVLLTLVARRNWLTMPSLICVLAFWWLHILGARYAYSNVPYDDWSTALFGASISRMFGWERNQYDRLMHFMFGLLCMRPVVEIAIRRGRMSLACAMAFALAITMALGAFYEIGEWLLTAVVSPRDAASYNGQQGDMWDPQKDMALAALGAIVAMPVVIWQCQTHKDVFGNTPG